MNATEGRSGKTALHYAVNKRQGPLVQLLATPRSAGGCEVEMNLRDWAGRTPLQCAEALLRPISAEESQSGVGSLSLEQSNLHVILNQKNFNGEHCLHLATYGEHYDFIRFLCWSGADMNATEGRSGKTALHYAVNKRQE